MLRDRNVDSVDLRERVLAELDRILCSSAFRRAETLSRFLQFIVECTLDGNVAALKEYSVGLDVFKKRADFNPRDQALVRVEANRLRRKLTAYYRTWGSADPLLISVPKGAYVARFEQRPTAREARRLIQASSPIDAIAGTDGFASIGTRTANWWYRCGLHLLEKWDEHSLARCAGLCGRAIAYHPESPALHGLLSLSLTGLYWFDVLPPHEIVPMVREAAAAALNLDRGNVHALLASSYVAWLYDRDPDAADAWLCAADKTGSRDPFLAYYRSLRLAWAHSYSEADPTLAGAHDRGDWSLAAEREAAFTLLASGRYREAIVRFRSIVALEEYSPLMQWLLGCAELYEGETKSAIQSLQKAAELNHQGSSITGILGFAYASIGHTHEANRLLSQLRQRSDERYVSKLDIAKIYGGLGQHRKALEYVLLADAERSGRIVTVTFLPEFEGLRIEKGLWRMLTRSGLGMEGATFLPGRGGVQCDTMQQRQSG